MNGRPAIVRLDESVDGGDARVTVALEWGEDRYHGASEGDADPVLRPRLVGEATLRAVEAVASGELALSLEAVATTELGDTRIATAQIRIVGTDHLLVGSALLSESDPSLATVKAVLDAINRPLTKVL